MSSAGTDYTFGPFRLSLDRRQLLEGQQPVRIGSRAFDLLSLLVERAGEVISKEALIKRAWPTVVVEEASLRFHIALMRKLLGDGQDGARYIANISGRGYSFVALVQREDAPAAPSLPETASGAPTATPSHNLPVRLARMVGRQALLHELAELLLARRLVTIVAPGGMGKSTLALSLAELLLPRHPQGVWFVDLSLLKEASLVPSAVATALGIGVDPQDALARLIAELKDRDTLLLLDNCEHVRPGVTAFVEALMPEASGVHVLATSREALSARHETVCLLPPLSSPAPDTHGGAREALTYSAVQLFVERSIAALDSFELSDADASAASEICRRLDGMPLAIELAAARVDSFGVHGLLQQLEDRFPLLSATRRGTPDRHRTLRALLDWSHTMLGPLEQRLLRQVSIFCGPFDLTALSRVTIMPEQGAPELLELMSGLASRSLISVDSSQHDIHYRLLDTTRLYALEQLRQSEEHADIRRRHADHLRDTLSESAHDWISMTRQSLMQKYAHLVDEVRAALDWAFEPGGDVQAGLELLVEAAGPLGHLVVHPEEFAVRTRQALQHQGGTLLADPSLAYRLHILLGTLSMMSRGPNTLSDEAFKRAGDLSSSVDNRQIQAESCNARFVEAFGAAKYGEALRHADAYSQAVAAQHSEMQSLTGDRLRALCLHFLGHHDQAVPLIERVLHHPSPVVRLGPAYPYDRRVSMRMLLARSLWIQGQPDQAMATAEDALRYAEQEQAMAMSHALAWAACPIALWNGQYSVAARHVADLKEHSELHRRGYWAGWADGYDQVLTCQKRSDAPTDLNSVFADMDSINTASLCDMLATFGHSFLVEDTLTRVRQGLVGWCAPEVLRAAGDHVLAGSDPDAAAQAEALYQEALTLAGQQSALGWELRAAASLARLWLRQGRRPQALAVLEPTYRRFREGWQHADLRAAQALLEEA